MFLLWDFTEGREISFSRTWKYLRSACWRFVVSNFYVVINLLWWASAAFMIWLGITNFWKKAFRMLGHSRIRTNMEVSWSCLIFWLIRLIVIPRSSHHHMCVQYFLWKQLFECIDCFWLSLVVGITTSPASPACKRTLSNFVAPTLSAKPSVQMLWN